MRVFVIGDIHGCSKTFRYLTEETIGLQKSDRLYCIGDYVDRGPDAKGVVDYIFTLREAGFEVLALRGNHEQIMMDAQTDPDSHRVWLNNGGVQTLQSFGAEHYAEIPEDYRNFFASTAYWLTWEDWIIVHAGLDFLNADPLSDLAAMLWIRGFTPDPDWLNGRRIVHGHTPQPLEDLVRNAGPMVWNVDSGCVYPTRQGMGRLCALELTTRTYYDAPNIDFH